MAGNYDDAPGHRMAYDQDGTIVIRRNWNTDTLIDTVSGSDLIVMNDESSGRYAAFPKGAQYELIFIFPELRDIVGYVSQGNGAGETQVWRDIRWSANTTNGIDGTWTTTTQDYAITGTFNPTALRNDIVTLSLSGVKAVGFGTQQDGGAVSGGPLELACHHLFGSIASGQNPDRLRIWHPTLDQEVGPAYFDWAEQERGATNTITFRVKNQSATLTANSIAINMEALTDTTPTNVSQHTFSTDNVTYLSTINIGNLSAGALSSVLYMKRTTPSNAALGLWWTRMQAIASSWT